MRKIVKEKEKKKHVTISYLVMNSDLIGRHQILNTYLYMATQTAATSDESQ